MFNFLEAIYQDQSLTLDELKKAVEVFNQAHNREEKIRAVDLKEGAYVSKRKYMAKCRKLNEVKEELELKDKKCMEMRMRILILEQRLHAYELMMTCEQQGMK